MVGTAPVSSTRKEVFTENDVNSIKQGIQARTGVFSGCVVSVNSGLILDISAGTVFANGVSYASGSTTKTLVPNAVLDVQAILFYDETTGVGVEYGTPGAPTSTAPYFERYTPAPPSLPVSGARVILAQVYLPAATVTITASMILDKRVLLRTSVVIPLNGVFNFYASDGTTLVAQISEDGNLYLLGRVVSL
jgi:hypothetical protein